MNEPILATNGTRSGLDEVRTNIYSLNLIAQVRTMTGLDPWVEQVAAKLREERFALNRRVMIGLHYVVVPIRDFDSFPEYLDDLGATPALALRQRMLDVYESRPVRRSPASGLTQAQALKSEDNYFDYVIDRFGMVEEGSLDDDAEDIERWAYRTIRDPDAMKELILEHLRYMWSVYLEEEWERRKPELRRLLDLPLDFEDNAVIPRFIACREPTAAELQEWIAAADEVLYLPSPHIGPYFGRIRGKNRLYILYGLASVRFDGQEAFSPRNLAGRFQALADEGRLEIVSLLLRQGDLSSPQIAEALGLSSSGASRQLSLLSALGFLEEYRCDGSRNMKCYRIRKSSFAALAQSLTQWVS